MKKIVVKLTTTCADSKPLILTVVAKLEGVKSIDFDVDKGTLTVVGTVDPVCIIAALRKKKVGAQIDSVAEDKKEDDKDKKKKECEELCKKIAECCGSCGIYGPCSIYSPCDQRVVPYMPYRNTVCYEEAQSGCIIS